MIRALKTLLIVLGLLVAAPAFGKSPEQDFMRGKQAALEQVYKQPKGDARTKRLEEIFNSMLDYEHLAKASLGKYWDGRSEAQRVRFRNVLTQLVQRAYRRNLDKTLNYQVDFVGEKPVDGAVLVETKAMSRSNKREDPVSIDYLVRKVAGKFLVQDIVTAGASLVKNYQRQFARIIRKKSDENEGFEDLLKRMESKLGED